MLTANDVADWFLAWADVNEADVSNLKIQKLIYYAQGHSLGAGLGPIFDDKLEAWAHGPVVPSVYRRFKKYGSGTIEIEEEISEEFNWDEFVKFQDVLMRVWNTYGPKAAWTLRNRTHRETPWIEAFDNEERNSEISQESMRSFFASTQ